MERGLVPRGHLVFCHYERSEVIQKQVLLANRLLHPVGVRNDKFRIVMARSLLRRRGHLSAICHRERSVAICWQVDCRAVYSTRLAMTRTERQV